MGPIRSRFGDAIREGLLPDAVRAFFDNGGRTCFVVRAGPSSGMWHAGAVIPIPGHPRLVLNVRALDPGRSGEQIVVQLVPRPAGRFSVVVRAGGNGRVGASERERWTDLVAEDDGLTSDETRAVSRVLARAERGSKLIRAAVEHSPAPESTPRANQKSEPLVFPKWLQSSQEDRREKRDQEEATRGPVRLRRPVQAGGNGSGTAFDRLTLAHLTGEGAPVGAVWGLAALELRPEVSLVAIPDLVWALSADDRKPVPARCGKWPIVTYVPDPRPARRPFTPADILTGQRAIIRHCERLRDRFAVLDTPFDEDPPTACTRARNCPPHSPRSTTRGSALARRLDGDTTIDRAVPPSGAVVGMIARGPAGRPAQGTGERATARRAGTRPRARRASAGPTPCRVGEPGRCRARARDPRHRGADARPARRAGVAVRQLAQATPDDRNGRRRVGHEVAFEGNSAARRADLTRMLRSFLADLWREGALDGATDEQAFEVTCDDCTTPPEEQDAGRLICVIRVKPPAPAEYVIVRIGVAVGEVKGVLGA